MVGICKVGFRFESHRDVIYYNSIFTSNVGSTITSFLPSAHAPVRAHSRRQIKAVFLFIYRGDLDKWCMLCVKMARRHVHS